MWLLCSRQLACDPQMNPRNVLGSDFERYAAGTAAVSSTEVRSGPMQVESRKRAADTAIEDIGPRMEGNEETADDGVTLSAGQCFRLNMEMFPVGSGHCRRRTCGQQWMRCKPGGPVPLEDLFPGRHAVVFVAGRCERRSG